MVQKKIFIDTYIVVKGNTYEESANGTIFLQ